MVTKLILDRKRQGAPLETEEIRFLVDGFVRGEVSDAQMAAFAMAACCRGLTERETSDLTDAMMRSGVALSWSGPTADKHSTGGVGDKLSLVVQPLAAACGVAVPSLVGRGLGLTGGTADKLESIPGYDCSLSAERFSEVVRASGVSMATQTEDLCPADRKLYALRDVTGTVASLPLITASILSKKLAEGAGALVFDVKCGRGAFMKTRDEAAALACSLVNGARAAGRKAAALVTAMDEPLGFATGNANEVAEAVAMLERRDVRLAAELSLCVELSARMVALALGRTLEDARAECRARLDDGSAFEKFKAMVAAHGGDLAAFERFLKRPVSRFRVQAMKSGFVASVDAEKVAKVALALGAGRAQPGERIDHLAGVSLEVRRGDRVSAGAAIATLETASAPDALEPCAAELLSAFSISREPPAAKPLVLMAVD